MGRRPEVTTTTTRPPDPTVTRNLPFRLMLAELSPSAQARVARAMADAGYNDEGMAPFTSGVRRLDSVSVLRSG
jgi:hypothetical protein